MVYFVYIFTKMPRKTRRSCEVCGIREANLTGRLFFANFPLDENRCRQWIQVTGNSDLVHLPIDKLHTIKHVCANHFKRKDFNRSGNRLKKRAVPCLNLLSEPLSDMELLEFPPPRTSQDMQKLLQANKSKMETAEQSNTVCSSELTSLEPDKNLQDIQTPKVNQKREDHTYANQIPGPDLPHESRIEKQNQKQGTCCVRDCENNGIFPFPEKESTCREWESVLIHNNNIKSPSLRVICAAHFQPSDFTSTKIETLGVPNLFWKGLKLDAVPSLLLPNQEHDSSAESMVLNKLTDTGQEENTAPVLINQLDLQKSMSSREENILNHIIPIQKVTDENHQKTVYSLEIPVPKKNTTNNTVQKFVVKFVNKNNPLVKRKPEINMKELTNMLGKESATRIDINLVRKRKSYQEANNKSEQQRDPKNQPEINFDSEMFEDRLDSDFTDCEDNVENLDILDSSIEQEDEQTAKKQKEWHKIKKSSPIEGDKNAQNARNQLNTRYNQENTRCPILNQSCKQKEPKSREEDSNKPNIAKENENIATKTGLIMEIEEETEDNHPEIEYIDMNTFSKTLHPELLKPKSKNFPILPNPLAPENFDTNMHLKTDNEPITIGSFSVAHGTTQNKPVLTHGMTQNKPILLYMTTKKKSIVPHETTQNKPIVPHETTQTKPIVPHGTTQNKPTVPHGTTQNIPIWTQSGNKVPIVLLTKISNFNSTVSQVSVPNHLKATNVQTRILKGSDPEPPKTTQIKPKQKPNNLISNASEIRILDASKVVVPHGTTQNIPIWTQSGSKVPIAKISNYNSTVSQVSVPNHLKATNVQTRILKGSDPEPPKTTQIKPKQKPNNLISNASEIRILVRGSDPEPPKTTQTKPNQKPNYANYLETKENNLISKAREIWILPNPNKVPNPVPQNTTAMIQKKRAEYENLQMKIKAQKLRAQLKRMKARELQRTKKIKQLNDILTHPGMLNRIRKLPVLPKMLTMMQLRHILTPKNGRRYSKEELQFAVNLYDKDPEAYNFLQHIGYVLPTKKFVQTMVKKDNQSNSEQDAILKLKEKVSKMLPAHRLCILLFEQQVLWPENRKQQTQTLTDDGIEIAYETDHTLLFMVKSILSKYKEPVSYTFSCGPISEGDLAAHITNVISDLQSVGFTVLATVCAHTDKNRLAIEHLVNETRNAYLLSGLDYTGNIFLVNEKPIITIYDPPHLLRGIRNNLILNDLIYTENGRTKVAKWSYLQLALNENPEINGERPIPKFTEKLVHPTEDEMNETKYAAQIFSQTVASRMGYLAAKGILPPESQDTADLLIFFDQLFDSLNGFKANTNRSGKPLLYACKKDSAHHMNWKNSIKVLQTMRFFNNGVPVEVVEIESWIWTLQSVQLLMKTLLHDYNVPVVWMKSINQDVLDRLLRYEVNPRKTKGNVEEMITQ